MRTNIKATVIELTPSLADYVNSKMGMLDKLLVHFDQVYADVEVGKRTKHHKTGDWFFAEANLHASGHIFRNVVEEADLYAAIDEMKDNMAEEIRTYEKRQNTLLRKGQRLIKGFLLRR